MRKVKCADGSVKVIYRDPSRAFPIALKRLSADIQGAVEGLQAVSGKVAGEIQKEFQTLLIELDASNRSMQADFAAAYMAFASDPCHDPGYLHRKVDELQVERQSFQKLLVHAQLIERMIAEGAETSVVSHQIDQALATLVTPDVAAAKALVESAPDEVERWAAREPGC